MHSVGGYTILKRRIIHKCIVCLLVSSLVLALCVPCFAIVTEAVGIAGVLAGTAALGIYPETDFTFDNDFGIGFSDYTSEYVGSIWSMTETDPYLTYDSGNGTVNISGETAKTLAGFYSPHFNGSLSWSPNLLNVTPFDWGWSTVSDNYVTVNYSNGIPASVNFTDYYGGSSSALVTTIRVPVSEGDVVTCYAIPAFGTDKPSAHIANYNLWVYSGNNSSRVLANGVQEQTYTCRKNDEYIALTVSILCLKNYYSTANNVPIQGTSYFNRPLSVSSGVTDVTSSFATRFVSTNGTYTNDTINTWENLTSNQHVEIAFYDEYGNQILTGLNSQSWRDAMVRTLVSGERIYAYPTVIQEPLVSTPVDDYNTQSLGFFASIAKVLGDIKTAIIELPQRIADALAPAPMDDGAFNAMGGHLGNLHFSSIWHYVIEFVGTLGAGLALFGSIWSTLPYALVVPIYASAVVVIVVTVYKRYIA